MLGGSLSRYYTPTVQRGGALVEDLIKVAGPMVVDSMGRMVQDVQRGATASDAMRQGGQALKKTLKRKALPWWLPWVEELRNVKPPVPIKD